MTAQQTLRTLVISMAAVATFAGCKSAKDEKQAMQDPFFPPAQHVPASKTMFQVQHAIGAAEDGMLFDIHFDGDQLNSLGEQKLKGMLAVRSTRTPLKLYLNLAKDDAANGPRQTAVEKILQAEGLTAEQYALAIGPNPSSLRPAKAGVRALDFKRDTVGDATASGESTNLPVMKR